MFSSDKTLLLGLLVAASLIGGAPSPAAALRIDGQVQAGGGAVAGSTVTLWAGAPANRSRWRKPRQRMMAVLRSARTDARTGREPLSDRERRRPFGQQERGRQSGAGVSGRAGRQRPGAGHHKRDDDRRIGLDQRAVPRRRGAQGAGAQSEHRRGQRRRTSSICKPADGAGPSRTRSTAARRRRWRISPRSPMRSRVARRGSTPNACDMLFQAAKPPKGDAPGDTLTAAEAIARNSAYQPERAFALLDSFYPVPQGQAHARDAVHALLELRA